ncbi:MAG: phosphoribosylaminoimidazolesuccinocarboxamide synthase [Alphaproteobacteria bacterium]|nr:phosphoribosylaminoimidazolesuccinocarboxamide synthase [Alphaproteobacteria bacterium]
MSIKFRPRSPGEKIQPRRRHLFEGKTKILCDGPEPGTYVLYFKDDCQGSGIETDPLVLDEKITPKEIIGTGKIIGKGAINNRLSEMFMSRLDEIGVENHYLRRLNMCEQLVKATDPLPFVLTMNNIAVGDFAKRLGLDEGMALPEPIPEFRLKGVQESIQGSIISAHHITALGWADKEEIKVILDMAQRINDFLWGQFLALGMRIMHYDLEFGRVYMSEYMEDAELILIDEISADTCHILDIKTSKRFVVNDDPSDIGVCYYGRAAYQEIARRFGILTAGGPPDLYQEVAE